MLAVILNTKPVGYTIQNNDKTNLNQVYIIYQTVGYTIQNNDKTNKARV